MKVMKDVKDMKENKEKNSFMNFMLFMSFMCACGQALLSFNLTNNRPAVLIVNDLVGALR
jgi:hypothetical protein